MQPSFAVFCSVCCRLQHQKCLLCVLRFDLLFARRINPVDTTPTSKQQKVLIYNIRLGLAIYLEQKDIVIAASDVAPSPSSSMFKFQIKRNLLNVLEMKYLELDITQFSGRCHSFNDNKSTINKWKYIRQFTTRRGSYISTIIFISEDMAIAC